MEIKKLKSWEEFEDEYRKKIDFTQKRSNETQSSVSDVLFRGQCDADWHLRTTLDRIAEKMPYRAYYYIMQGVKPDIETCTGDRWNLADYKEPKQSIFVVPCGYEFMIYLRHCGFPSPLLDWTRSPYIAAYFAFQNENEGKDVAIFAYIKDIGKGKFSMGDDAIISEIGQYVTTHKRHYLQQCDYTICTKRDNGNLVYWNHEEVFGKNEAEQDLLTKYILPSSERQKVLKKLDLMNINAYSLFGTTESLMETLKTRHFVIMD